MSKLAKRSVLRIAAFGGGLLLVAIGAVLFYMMLANNALNQINRDQIETQFSYVVIPASLKFMDENYHGYPFMEHNLEPSWEYTYEPAGPSSTLASIRADLVAALQQAGFSVKPPGTVPNNEVFSSRGNLIVECNLLADNDSSGASVRKVVITTSRLTY